jgi:hypothetical protein
MSEKITDEELKAALEQIAGTPTPLLWDRSARSTHWRPYVAVLCAAALAVIGAFVIVGSDSTSPRASSSPHSAVCFSVITYNGALYRSGFENIIEAQPERDLGEATTQACEDSPQTAVQISAIRGISPSVAVTGVGDVFVKIGYFPISETFPGRAPSAPLVRETASCVGALRATQFRIKVTTTSSLRINGTIQHVTAGPMHIGETLDALFVDSYTRFYNLDRDGAPYVPPGSALDVGGLECRNSDGGTEIVATSVSAAD